MLTGAIYIVFGFLFFFIPVIGWILGWLLIMVGFLKIIIGFIELLTPDKSTTYVTEKVIVKEEQATQQVSEPQYSMTDELEKLSKLFEKGHITEDEYNTSKKKIINPYSRS